MYWRQNKLRFIGGILLLLGTIAVFFAIVYRSSPSLRQPLVIDSHKLNNHQLDLLVERKFVISIYNPSSSSSRVVGCQGNGCGPGGCVYGIEPEAFDLAPGETKEIFVRYKSPSVPGPFEKEFIIYSATNTLIEHKLKVTGVAVKAKKESDSHHEDSKSTKEKSVEEKSNAIAKCK